MWKYQNKSMAWVLSYLTPGDVTAPIGVCAYIDVFIVRQVMRCIHSTVRCCILKRTVIMGGGLLGETGRLVYVQGRISPERMELFRPLAGAPESCRW